MMETMISGRSLMEFNKSNLENLIQLKHYEDRLGEAESILRESLKYINNDNYKEIIQDFLNALEQDRE